MWCEMQHTVFSNALLPYKWTLWVVLLLGSSCSFCQVMVQCYHLGWEADLQGESFVLVVSRVLRLMDFSVFLFYFSPLLLIQKTKSSYQQGLSPPSQSPNSCSPDSPVQCEEKVLRASSWNFILRTKWCWDLLPPVQSPWHADLQSLSSPTLLHKQVHVLALEKHFSSVET